MAKYYHDSYQKIFQVVVGHFNQIPLFIPVTGPLTNRIMEGFIFNYNINTAY